MKVEELIRKEIIKLSLYDGETGSSQANEAIVKLDMNENFFVGSDFVRKLLVSCCENVDIRLYPAPYGKEAIVALSRFLDFDESEIYIGNGIDEILELLMKVFVSESTKVIVVEPTFSMYSFFIQLYGGKKVTAFLQPNFALDPKDILYRGDPATSLLFLCSPNNPTGNQFPKEDVEKIVREFNGVVIIDEAYVDFGKYTVLEWVKKFKNLIVLRTVSKAFGLAGIRFGYLVTNKAIVEYVKRVALPYNVNLVTQRLICSALEHSKYIAQQAQHVIKERTWLTKKLEHIAGVTPYPSDANFILFRVKRKNISSKTITKKLMERHVFVRDRGTMPLLQNCIRVTVGTRDMNNRFLFALERTLEGNML